jgi:hypothetical protein
MRANAYGGSLATHPSYRKEQPEMTIPHDRPEERAARQARPARRLPGLARACAMCGATGQPFILLRDRALDEDKWTETWRSEDTAACRDRRLPAVLANGARACAARDDLLAIPASGIGEPAAEPTPSGPALVLSVSWEAVLVQALADAIARRTPNGHCLTAPSTTGWKAGVPTAHATSTASTPTSSSPRRSGSKGSGDRPMEPEGDDGMSDKR